MVTLLPGGGEPGRTGFLTESVLVVGRHWPQWWAQNNRPLLAPVRQEAGVGPMPIRWRELAGTAPAGDAPVPHPRRYGALNTAGALGQSARHLRQRSVGSCIHSVASVSRAQTP